ncbi:MAG: serine hydrolase [Phycisphaerales bacterium]|nr:MAG: serine hydrolase [Phycisphaerales bacterium]
MLSLACFSSVSEAGPQVRNDNPQPPADVEPHTPLIYYPLNPRREGDAGDADRVIPEDLLRQFMEYHTAMRYEDAAELALQLVEVAPDRPMVHYNLACVMGRLGRNQEALAALEKAIDCGWRNRRHMIIEPDLATVRRSDEFASLLIRMQQLSRAERMESRPLRAEPVEEIRAELVRQVPEWLDSYHVPGAAVAVVRDGQVAWTGAFGLLDDPEGEAMSADALFQLSAPLHLLAMVAALQQEAEGNVDLPHLLAQAAELNGIDRRSARSPAVIRPVAHGSGSVAYLLPYPDRDRRRKGPSRWPAGGRSFGFGDSSMTYTVLYLAVEMASEEDFSRYCRRNILTPLGMTDTVFEAPKEEEPPRLAVGHSRLGTPTEPLPVVAGKTAMICTTAGDLGQLVASLMSGPSSPIPVLDQDELERVGSLQEALPGGLGLAFRIRQTPYGRCVDMTGNANGVGCLVRFYPRRGVGTVVLFNSETGLEAARRIAHLALGGEG